MFRRYAVEIYFFLAALFLAGSLVFSAEAIRYEEPAKVWGIVLVLPALVFGTLAMIATEVREKESHRG